MQNAYEDMQTADRHGTEACEGLDSVSARGEAGNSGLNGILEENGGRPSLASLARAFAGAACAVALTAFVLDGWASVGGAWRAMADENAALKAALAGKAPAPQAPQAPKAAAKPAPKRADSELESLRGLPQLSFSGKRMPDPELAALLEERLAADAAGSRWKPAKAEAKKDGEPKAKKDGNAKRGSQLQAARDSKKEKRKKDKSSAKQERASKDKGKASARQTAARQDKGKAASRNERRASQSAQAGRKHGGGRRA